MRRLEAVVFKLATEWFGCRVAPRAQEEIEQLPEAAHTWFEQYALSPAASDFHPNKDELWLHFSLLDSRAECWRVARRRLFPGNLPPRLGLYALRRLRHHALALPRAVVTGLDWRWRTQGLGPQFWLFVFSALVFNFALFIFMLLYNLFLLDLGFREDFVGVVNGAMRAGSLAGTLPAALLAHRLGLKKTLLVTIVGTAAAEVLRALAGARLPLAALAFVSGSIFSVWAVILAPLIAGAVEEKRRPAAFSVFFACMFAVGIAGNWLGGLLPLWMGGKRAVLLWAAALSGVAVLPALRLKEWPRVQAGSRVWPRSRFLALYLAPFALWHLATGTFNPFNNVYFARLGFAVQRIGSVFSISQLVQVAALLMAPAIIRRLGLLGAIVVMMIATAFGLGALAAQPPAAAAVAAYMAYMAFQWMSEPGLNTLLMNEIEERHRSGASALNYLVAFGAQALAAFAAGGLFTRFGYGWTLAGAGTLALTAAGLFAALLRAPEKKAPRGETVPV
jgi:MFS family permease